MKCSKCSKEAVITQDYSGLSLCESHEISDIVLKAKKEIRKSGGLASGERIFVKGADNFGTYALRVFLSELFLKRTDILFVEAEEDASIVFESKTLDDVASELFKKVCGGDVSFEKENVRTVNPLSAVSRDEVFWYAKYHGWKGCEDEKTPDFADEFLDEFKKDHPGTLYALKNVSDELKRRMK